MKLTFRFLAFLLAGFFALTISSCGSKRFTYFNNIKKDTSFLIAAQAMEMKIAKNDILDIRISTLDESTTRLLSGASVGANTSAYLVDESGTIKIPLLGAIQAEGLTKRELSAFISSELLSKKIAKDPIVTIRFTNFRITVLGEVGRPGVILVPNERITLPEALGTAGDLTIYGRRNNVVLIRETDGKRIIKHFSLNNEDMFKPELYNLQNQDIIYVQPNEVKGGTSNRASQIYPLVLTTTSFLILLYVQFLK